MTDVPKRGRGRPRSADPRSKLVTLRFTADELEAIESAAASTSALAVTSDGPQVVTMTPSEWARERVLDALGLGVPTLEMPTAS